MADSDDLAMQAGAQSLLPARTATDLTTLLAGVKVLAGAGHERMTIQQALFFLAAAHQAVIRQPATVSRIRDEYEPLGRSVEKSSLQFLEPGRVAPSALGWLEQQHDPNDKRVRYLTLTAAGKQVVAELVAAMRAS